MTDDHREMLDDLQASAAEQAHRPVDARERLWKTRDVADLFGVEMSTVLDWVERGWIPCFRLGGRKGGRLRFVRSEVEHTLESWRVGGPPDEESP
jgi:hypothetical protein